LLSWGLIGLGVAAIALKAALFGSGNAWIGEPKTWLERFGDDALGIAGGVLFAAGGINEFATRIQRKLRARETATRVLTLLDQATARLKRIARSIYAIVEPAFDPDWESWEIPWIVSAENAPGVSMPDKEELGYRQVSDKFDAAAKHLATRPSEHDARRKVQEAAKAKVPEILRETAELRPLITEIAEQWEGDGQRLEAAAVEL
jgi:hypothetical protein